MVPGFVHTVFAALLLAAHLVPQAGTIASAGDRVKDPARDPLPADARAADEIRRGYAMFQNTPANAPRYSGNALSCGTCHLNAGQKAGALPLVGIASVFPQYNVRAGRMFSLEQRIVGCFLRSINAPGPAQPTTDAPEVRAIAAYLRWISDGVTSAEVRGWHHPAIAKNKLLPVSRLDPARGRELYAAQCASCHGADGQGVRLGDLLPGPLWGPRSWNDGAGVARVWTLARYLRGAMPYYSPGSLSDEQAQEIAAYLTSLPRPAYAGKQSDYPKDGPPPDAVYYAKSAGH